MAESTEMSIKSVSIKESTEFEKGNGRKASNRRRSSFLKKLSMSFRRWVHYSYLYVSLMLQKKINVDRSSFKTEFAGRLVREAPTWQH